ncbi:protein kinase C zeta type isoform X3 [Poecilia reticulata]|uniref:protein kinase C zeta type isoform X3 n=1 Tax=Poecilia reticulata TaxID=8081 RepID=UPI0004A2528C|nr:PREDICTED: protein kinase C zeta type isoform X3 [Poecilia reticulata]
MHMLASNGSIMDLNSEWVKVKAHYRGLMLITDLAATVNFVELCEEVRTMCSVAKQQPITLKWIDDEGDPCTISSQMELEEALRIYSRSKRSVLLLHVFPSTPEKPGMPCPGEDKSVYRRGARRWRKLYRVNGHLFQAKSFNRDPVMPSQEPPADAKREEVDVPPDDTEDTDGISFLPHNCAVDKRGDAETEDSDLNPLQDIKAVVDGIDGIKLSQGTTLGLGDFELIRVIGRGSYAKVLLVRLKKNEQVFAMKVVKKELVHDDEDIDWVQTEKHVFEQASTNPFLVGLHSCFQTESRLFLVIEYVNGGDLMFHMQRQRKLPEDHARFYAAEICIALNFLHEKGIIYRDLKLDNVLLDHEGHIKLTDYGMCKEGIRPGDTTSTFCGTPNYIAPEILRGEDYGFSVDWWALGVLMFEMMAGRSPFDIITDNPDMNTEEYLFQVILEKPIRIPRSLSVKAASVLKGFLNKDPKERLGCQVQTGFTDIKSHTFFRNIDWDQLEKKEMTAPFKPQISDEYGLENFDTQFTNEPVQLTPDDEDVIKRIDQSEFEGFEYINPLLLSTEESV